MPKSRIIVTSESPTGRNTCFLDTYTGSEMSRSQFIKQIKSGNYNDYYVRNINGVATPVSKPDGCKANNLG